MAKKKTKEKTKAKPDDMVLQVPSLFPPTGKYNVVVDNLTTESDEETKQFSKPEDDVLEQWKNFWAPVVTDKNGRLNRYAVMRELFDYGTILDNASRIIYLVTDGLASKPNTDPDVVFGLASENWEKQWDALLKDWKDAWDEEHQAELNALRAEVEYWKSQSSQLPPALEAVSMEGAIPEFELDDDDIIVIEEGCVWSRAK